MNFIDTRCVERKEDAVQFRPNSAVAAFRALRPNPAEAEKLRKETEMRLRHRTSRNRVHAHENASKKPITFSDLTFPTSCLKEVMKN